MSSRDERTLRGDRLAAQVAENRARQAEIYGEPLVERVHRIVRSLGTTQARLAEALGMSPAMLSQLVGGRRVKIGDPAVLSRLAMLHERCARPVPTSEVPALLAQVRATVAAWQEHPPNLGTSPARVPRRAGPVPGVPARDPVTVAAEALRGIAGPARLVAAAAQLGPGFPELAELLRQAAGTRRETVRRRPHPA
ncbi:hypothetical protein GCM10009836_04920 [Pseudonocardia ailaonensis]|uniref:DNA-binding protein n=1 Tax=Pseudonocardia ailaonensis TaxID=367279 RepID=A0ABN2MKV5_9PSEU